MQIPPTSSAAHAAGILAQSTAKDKASGMSATPSGPAAAHAAHVEKSGSTDADRDAQGQADGFREQPHPEPEPEDILDVTPPGTPRAMSAQLRGEPPSQLDIVG